MVAHRAGTDQVQTQLIGQFLRLGVQIVKDFHVIGKKTDRRHHHVVHSGCVGLPQAIADVGLEPRLAGRPAAALIGQVPLRTLAGPSANRSAIRRPVSLSWAA